MWMMLSFLTFKSGKHTGSTTNSDSQKRLQLQFLELSGLALNSRLRRQALNAGSAEEAHDSFSMFEDVLSILWFSNRTTMA